MRRTLTDAGVGTEFWQAFETYEHSAWRWEQQPIYEITDERASIDALLAGHPLDPMEDPYLGPWMRQVALQTAQGKTIARVRVIEEPPTPYQQWERWLDRWNLRAGEVIEYLPRSAMRELGPPPFEPDSDWWLFDDERLMLLHFDEAGRRVRVELLVDEPENEMALRWREKVIAAARGFDS